MLYTFQNQSTGIPMPLLMGYTFPTPIETTEDERVIYDPILQRTQFDMRTLGTRCLRSSITKHGPGKLNTSDKKNEIDDQKTV